MRGGSRAQGVQRGADLRYNMTISLDEAFKGRQSTIKVPTSVGCDACSGTGAEGGAAPITCPTCNGHGRVRAQQGFFTIERTRSAEHTSELQSLMRISYAVFCLKKTNLPHDNICHTTPQCKHNN